MTRQLQLGNVCPITDESCRFLSMEWTAKAFTKIEIDAHTGMYKPVGMGSRKVLLGVYCNNHPIKQSGWVTEMKSCPTLEGANAVPVRIPVKRGRKPK